MILSFFDPLRNPLSFFDPLRDCAVVPERYVATMNRQGWVKPVRCEHCKKWERDQDPMDERLDTHLCTRCMFFTAPDDYCSYAEVLDNADGETPLSR